MGVTSCNLATSHMQRAIIVARLIEQQLNGKATHPVWVRTGVSLLVTEWHHDVSFTGASDFLIVAVHETVLQSFASSAQRSVLSLVRVERRPPPRGPTSPLRCSGSDDTHR
jgi:hypothetical protein